MRTTLLALGLTLTVALPAAAQSMGGGGGGGGGGGMSAPKLPDPPSLRTTHVRYYPQSKLDIDGKVLLKFIVDTMGRPEPNSFEILKVSDSAFVEPARLTVLAQEYRPARDHGQNMRSYATSEIKFKAGKMPCDAQMKGATGTICVDSLDSKH